MAAFNLSIILFVSTVFLSSVECWFWEHNHEILNRTKRGVCNGGFKCDNGACISGENVCDGIVHCQDGSDEKNSCAEKKCQKILFRCKYGACINKKYVCDGIQHCRDNSDETTPKCKPPPPAKNLCGLYKFLCTNGDCINSEYQCDGRRNCRDGSDETVELCLTKRCRKYEFMCKYGACINRRLRCNGIKDCDDNSDESNCPDGITTTTATTTQTPLIIERLLTNNCALPPFPKQGNWSIMSNLIKNPGEEVKPGTIIEFKCEAGYKLYPDVILSVCREGNWSPLPECIGTCPPIYSTNKLKVSCKFRDSNISCSNPYEGTEAEFECTYLYEFTSIEAPRMCHKGKWNEDMPQCKQVCGLSISANGAPFVAGGENVQRGSYPWHVGVYNATDLNQICGASIISTKIIISAAHCFKKEKDQYLLAAGKYYRKYNHSEDKYAQYSKIKTIMKHRDYNHIIENENNDLAILIVEEPFKFGAYVLPVCVDYSPKFDYSDLRNKKGVVMGWGTTETRMNSETLKELTVEYKSNDECILPEGMQIYYKLARDKICAGLLNQGKSACKGDSGGSLVFRGLDNRYYLRGIVSVGTIVDGICDSSQLTLFTGVYFHKKIIFNATVVFPD